MSMLDYIGNGPYCYANSAAMLLDSVGESIEPRLLEVLSGVGLGAFWLAESQTLFLSGWASMPDVGISRAFGLLGFKVAEEAESDGAPMPAEALARQLDDGPVLLGPLDLGALPYQPDSQGGNGIDHFVLALGIEGDEVIMHDPDGYPAVPIALEALDRAWRADLIDYRKGPYRRWHSPVRVESPAPEEISEMAIQSFAQPTESPEPRFPRKSLSAPRRLRPWLQPSGLGPGRAGARAPAKIRVGVGRETSPGLRLVLARFGLGARRSQAQAGAMPGEGPRCGSSRRLRTPCRSHVQSCRVGASSRSRTCMNRPDGPDHASSLRYADARPTTPLSSASWGSDMPTDSTLPHRRAAGLPSGLLRSLHGREASQHSQVVGLHRVVGNPVGAYVSASQAPMD